MTLNKPYLFVNRLVVISNTGTSAYDEVFHHGVNIIRGKNSSGKSTISNFLFYALGGDFSHWTTAAAKCHSVMIEVEISGAILTLKRLISQGNKQPMQIFYGPYIESIKSNNLGWMSFPYQQNDNKESFSNIIFNTLEFPEVRNDNDNNLTLHQILRLIYIDQMTPVENLFMFERFDPPLMKQTIAEVLLGIYDDSLYDYRIQLRNAKKEQDEKQRQYSGLSKILTASGNDVNLNNVLSQIATANQELVTIQEEIIKLREEENVKRRKNEPLKIELLQNGLSPLKNEITSIKSSINSYELEVVDSELFIDSLASRVKAINTSILTKKILGELPLSNCPQCLSPLSENVPENICGLCKQPISEEEEKTQAKRLKQEIEIQIKESTKILEEKKKNLFELSVQLPSLISKARLLQKEIDIAENENRSSREEFTDDLLVKKGGIEKTIDFLNKQLKSVEILDVLRKELQELSKSITIFEQEIQLRLNNQESNLQIAKKKIEDITIKILKADLDRQAEFKNAKKVDIDFGRDTFMLDGNNNFSASSNTYLKNAVRFSIFFASLELSFFRFPRLIICDNMEDNGMEQIRTQYFQKVIVAMSQSYNIEHQIIFSTSMIADSLEGTGFCIGKYYDQTHKSLDV